MQVINNKITNIPDISNMTLRQKIGQLFIVRDDVLYEMLSDSELKGYLEKNPIGGIWATSLLKRPAEFMNFDSAEQGGTLRDLKTYINLINSYLTIPVIVGGDSEKGGYMGSAEISGPDAVVAADEVSLAYRYGACVANELKCGGLNWRWSPISDLCHHDSAISVNRVCSDEPEKVIEFSKALIKGSQDSGVAATVKHFPGQDINEIRDSHFMSSINNASFEDWMATQGRVYKEAIDSGVYSVMIGHHAFPAIDDTKIGNKRRPATFSKKIITDLLKKEWGFDGVVVTDDIGMRSAFSMYGRENMGLMYTELIKAGNDMILGSPIGRNFEDYIGEVEKAVKNGELSEERVDDACRRVFELKKKVGLFDQIYETEFDEARLKKATEQTHIMNKEIAEKSLTLISNSNGLLPLNKSSVKKVAIVSITHFEPFVQKLEELKNAFADIGVDAEIIEIGKCNLKYTSENFDIILYANFVSAHKPFGHCSFFGTVAQQFFKVLSYGSEKSVVVSFGSPFLRREYYEEAETYINAYWYNREVMEALVKALFGDIPFVGKSPFDI